jgi:predicted AAA+ superfamily ATPase
MILRPNYIEKIMAYADTPFVKILSGVRRCGKSTILNMIAGSLRERGIPDGRILVYKLDSMQYDDIKTAKRFYGEIHPEFARYLRYGGFPAVHLQDYSTDEAYAIVEDIYNSTIFTDIVKHSQIRKIDQFERIVRFAFDNIGRTFSAAAISKYLKSEHRTIDNETVMSYLSKLESAFILHRSSRYDLQGKEILKTQEKFFVCDPAMKYSVLGYTPDSVAAMLENVVYIELLRRGYDVYIGQLADGEIDFVATKQENKLYIQISEQILSDKTEQREYGRLLSIRDNYPKYVLRTDEFAGGNQDGVKTMHVADFLLSQEY